MSAALRGRQLKLLVAIDDYTLECLVIEVGHSFTAQDKIGILRYLFAVRGAPEYSRSNNGPEFVAQADDVPMLLSERCKAEVQKAVQGGWGHMDNTDFPTRQEVRGESA